MPPDPKLPVLLSRKSILSLFSSYALPEGNIAINDDDTKIDTASKMYFKNGTWKDQARIYHKESGTWVKRYLYKKVNGAWKKV